MRLVTSICVLCLLSLTAESHEQSEAVRESMDNAWEELFKFAYVKYGNRWRTAAILRSCEKEGIALQIIVADNDINDALMEELAHLMIPPEPELSALFDASPLDVVGLVPYVISATHAYTLGYQEAIDMLVESDPDLCDVSLMIANDILEGKLP